MYIKVSCVLTIPPITKTSYNLVVIGGIAITEVIGGLGIKGVSHYTYFNFKTILYQVNYIFSGKLPYFPATCLKYNNFIGGISLQLDRK